MVRVRRSGDSGIWSEILALPECDFSGESFCAAYAFSARCRGKGLPQRLKPDSILRTYGTTQVVPFPIR